MHKSHLLNLTVIYIPYSISFHKCQTAPETNNYQGDLVLQSKPDLLNGADLNLNSFVTHTFQVREMPGKVSGVCSGENQDCRAGLFTVNSHENQGKCCFDCCCFGFVVLLERADLSCFLLSSMSTLCCICVVIAQTAFMFS